MQDKQLTSAYRDHAPAFSSREVRTMAEVKDQLQIAPYLSPETIEQIVLTFPASYGEVAFTIAVERFVDVMRSHVLQLAVTYCQQAGEEGISVEEQNETLQNVEVDIHKIMTLSQRLNIDSVDKLCKLGKVTMSIMHLSHFKSAEETEASLYSLPGLYQDWLAQTHLFRSEQPE